MKKYIEREIELVREKDRRVKEKEQAEREKEDKNKIFATIIEDSDEVPPWKTGNDFWVDYFTIEREMLEQWHGVAWKSYLKNLQFDREKYIDMGDLIVEDNRSSYPSSASQKTSISRSSKPSSAKMLK